MVKPVFSQLRFCCARLLAASDLDEIKALRKGTTLSFWKNWKREDIGVVTIEEKSIPRP